MAPIQSGYAPDEVVDKDLQKKNHRQNSCRKSATFKGPMVRIELITLKIRQIDIDNRTNVDIRNARKVKH